MIRRYTLCLLIAIPFTSIVNGAQGERKRLSPHETVSVDLGGKSVTITYGRPYLKGRQLSKITQSGEVWRLGADEATKMTVSGTTQIGSGPELAPGSYSLFAVTGPEKWTLVINKVADQWGAFSYDKSKDLGRVDLPVKKAPSPVEEFTISLEKKSSSTAEMTLAWGDQSVSAPVKVH